MRNIKLTLEYDGTLYAGWQWQKNALSIQEVLTKALEKMTEEKISLNGASRTDSGVHALGQVAAFQTSRNIPCEGFLKGINNLLPADIRITDCEEVPLSFHPTTDAKRKTYLYLLEVGKVPSALLKDRVWWVGPKLDIEAMEEASRCLIGEHDFKSFRGARSDIKTTVRRIDKIEIGQRTTDNGQRTKKDAARFWSVVRCPLSIVHSPLSAVPLSFTGTGFLKYMVRNMVGTLVAVGIGKFSPKDVKGILEAKDRTQAGPTAPPQGLYLVKVDY